MPPEQSSATDPAEPIPLGQRFLDNWPLLMVLGIVIMLVVFTGWGLWEITSLKSAPLP
ncbi:MAG TPA: hypothetical protein VGA78_03490 [Gemmatimonadales bacterium]|jgi:hypothetical protein